MTLLECLTGPALRDPQLPDELQIQRARLVEQAPVLEPYYARVLTSELMDNLALAACQALVEGDSKLAMVCAQAAYQLRPLTKSNPS